VQAAPDILSRLTEVLALTAVKDSIIPSPHRIRAMEIVNRFNENEFELWKAGVRKGVENNSWSDLIAHRTYVSNSRTMRSPFIMATKLRNPKMRNVALGVPVLNLLPEDILCTWVQVGYRTYTYRFGTAFPCFYFSDSLLIFGCVDKQL
jgi:hypothetical protein